VLLSGLSRCQAAAIGSPSGRDIDRHGRTVGRVYVGALDVNAELVRRGDAWIYRQCRTNASLLKFTADCCIMRSAVEPKEGKPPFPIK
jgi:endonuclease YncB( thermonuclease family)